MEKDNKYYEVIANLVKSHKKYTGIESLLEDIIDDVYSHSEVILNTITNESVINAYLEKVVSTSVITVPKKFGYNNNAKSNTKISPNTEKMVNVSLVDKMINGVESGKNIKESEKAKYYPNEIPKASFDKNTEVITQQLDDSYDISTEEIYNKNLVDNKNNVIDSENKLNENLENNSNIQISASNDSVNYLDIKEDFKEISDINHKDSFESKNIDNSYDANIYKNTQQNINNQTNSNIVDLNSFSDTNEDKENISDLELFSPDSDIETESTNEAIDFSNNGSNEIVDLDINTNEATVDNENIELELSSPLSVDEKELTDESVNLDVDTEINETENVNKSNEIVDLDININEAINDNENIELELSNTLSVDEKEFTDVSVNLDMDTEINETENVNESNGIVDLDINTNEATNKKEFTDETVNLDLNAEINEIENDDESNEIIDLDINTSEAAIDNKNIELELSNPLSVDEKEFTDETVNLDLDTEINKTENINENNEIVDVDINTNEAINDDENEDFDLSSLVSIDENDLTNEPVDLDFRTSDAINDNENEELELSGTNTADKTDLTNESIDFDVEINDDKKETKLQEETIEEEEEEEEENVQMDVYENEVANLEDENLDYSLTEVDPELDDETLFETESTSDFIDQSIMLGSDEDTTLDENIPIDLSEESLIEEVSNTETDLLEESTISLDIDNSDTNLIDYDEEDTVSENSSHETAKSIPINYSVFNYEPNLEDLKSNIDVDLIVKDLEELASKNTDIDIIKIYNLKYKEKETIPKIATDLQISETQVVEALNEIIAVI